MRRTRPVAIDHDDKVYMPLGVLIDDVPGPRNTDPIRVEIKTAWLRRQLCPEHGLRPTHMYARWAKHPLVPLGERAAVMFLCPRGHAWEVINLEGG